MNVTPDGTIAVPLSAVKKEIKYASKLGIKSAAQSDMNIVRLLNVVQEGEVRRGWSFFVFPQLCFLPHSCAGKHSCASPSRPRPAHLTRHPDLALRLRAQHLLILVWELVKGMDVLDYLNSLGGVMSEPEARGFFRQLLSGIRCIHDNGFCHRDIKPENCMIETSTGTLKIIDFGLSKHLDSAKTLGIGTPDYMAPEMLSQGGDAAAGSRSYDPAAVDVWAMGVMLYLILTGTYPFEDLKQPGNVTATLRRVKEGRMNPLPANLGSEVRDLLARMIRADPRARIRLAAVAAHPWITAADDGVGERPPGADPEATAAASTCRSVPAGDAWVGAPPGLPRLDVTREAAGAPTATARADAAEGGGEGAGATFAGRMISRFFGGASSVVRRATRR